MVFSTIKRLVGFFSLADDELAVGLIPIIDPRLGPLCHFGFIGSPYLDHICTSVRLHHEAYANVCVSIL